MLGGYPPQTQLEFVCCDAAVMLNVDKLKNDLKKEDMEEFNPSTMVKIYMQ